MLGIEQLELNSEIKNMETVQFNNYEGAAVDQNATSNVNVSQQRDLLIMDEAHQGGNGHDLASMAGIAKFGSQAGLLYDNKNKALTISKPVLKD